MNRLGLRSHWILPPSALLLVAFMYSCASVLDKVLQELDSTSSRLVAYATLRFPSHASYALEPGEPEPEKFGLTMSRFKVC
jgi:hypothetical protein